MNKSFIVLFLQTTRENERPKIKNGNDFILSKEKETLKIVFYKGYKCSSQSVAHRLLNIPEILSQGQ